MAFSTTKSEVFVKKGVLKAVVTLNDTAGNSGAFQMPDASHICLHVEGTFGGGSVKFQASNDGTNFYDLPSGLSVSAAGIFALEETDRGFLHYRLVLSGGGASTALTCTVIASLASAGTP